MFCPQCATEVPADAKFCPACAASLPGFADATSSPALDQTAADSPGGFSAAPATAGANPYRAPAGGTADVPEHTLWEGGYSPQAMYGSWLLAGLATLAGLIVVAMWFPGFWGWTTFGIGVFTLWTGLGISLLYRQYTVHYKLTNLRFFREKGLLQRTTDRVEVIDMDDITTTQGFVERFLGVGNIRITSSDRSEPELILQGIANVRETADLIDRTRRTERNRRGVFIEQL